MVRLAWCRVHNGEFQQPRRSIFGVAVADEPGQSADLTFLGRTADSLTFSVTNGVAPDGYADPSAPGFRYDLATDEAVVLPQVAAPPTPPTFRRQPTAGLPVLRVLRAGAHLFPAVAVRAGAGGSLRAARALPVRSRARLVSPGLRSRCSRTAPGSTATRGHARRPRPATAVPAATAPTSPARRPATARCCCTTWRRWWSGATRCGAAATPGSVPAGARDLRRRAGILGRRPARGAASPASHAADRQRFTPDFPPLNPRLLEHLRPVDDRLALIHAASTRAVCGDGQSRDAVLRGQPAARGLARARTTPAPTSATGATCPAPTGSCS